MKKDNHIKFLYSSLWGWCLFDFANSIAAVIGGIYFSKWFIEDAGANSVIYNILLFTSALFILISGKWVGRKIDLNGYKFWIKLSSFISFIAMLFVFIGSKIIPNTFLIPYSFIFFLIFLFGYQISRICHNVYLRSVIPESKQAKMSGYGAASNWAGSIVGIIITIPIVTAFPDITGRELTFLAASVSYGILTFSALILMFSSKTNQNQQVLNPKSKLNWNYFFVVLGSSFVIYFLLFDVMITVEKNLPPYLSVVYKMTDDIQAIGFLSVLISAMLGGLFASKIVNFLNSNLWLKIGSSVLVASITMITINNPIFLWSAFVLAGLSYGILESTIRVNFMSTFKSENAGENFGILAAVERSSGVVGPLLWIIPFSIFQNEKHSYVASMLLMAMLAFFALILLYRKKHRLDLDR